MPATLTPLQDFFKTEEVTQAKKEAQEPPNDQVQQNPPATDQRENTDT